MRWWDPLVSLASGAVASVAIGRFLLPRHLREARADRDLWHGRCVHLTRIVQVLMATPANRAEARRLLLETKDEELMRNIASSLAPPPAEKC